MGANPNNTQSYPIFRNTLKQKLPNFSKTSSPNNFSENFRHVRYFSARSLFPPLVVDKKKQITTQLFFATVQLESTHSRLDSPTSRDCHANIFLSLQQQHRKSTTTAPSSSRERRRYYESKMSSTVISSSSPSHPNLEENKKIVATPNKTIDQQHQRIGSSAATNNQPLLSQLPRPPLSSSFNSAALAGNAIRSPQLARRTSRNSPLAEQRRSNSVVLANVTAAAAARSNNQNWPTSPLERYLPSLQIVYGTQSVAGSDESSGGGGGGRVMSEKVQMLAASIYKELERMIKKHGEESVKVRLSGGFLLEYSHNGNRLGAHASRRQCTGESGSRLYG